MKFFSSNFLRAFISFPLLWVDRLDKALVCPVNVLFTEAAKYISALVHIRFLSFSLVYDILTNVALKNTLANSTYDTYGVALLVSEFHVTCRAHSTWFSSFPHRLCNPLFHTNDNMLRGNGGPFLRYILVGRSNKNRTFWRKRTWRLSRRSDWCSWKEWVFSLLKGLGIL